MARSAPPPDLLRAGRYRILDRIAVGGMAEIFRATEDENTPRPSLVVVKRMLPHIAQTPGASAMFTNEARLGSHVQHPNVVRVLGSGTEGSQPYLVLEFVRGCDLWRLARHLAREGRVLPVELAIFLATELLAGLEAVHAAVDEEGAGLRIVHLDVSPSNVLLSTDGEVKLSDFGIARSTREPSPTIGKRAKGKIGYLAPELIAGRIADARADVFSAAVITAELLLGKPLFAGGSELAILLSIRDGRIDALRAIAPSLPTGVANALIAALAPDPIARTPNAKALREALVRAVPIDPAPLRLELGEIVSAVMRESAPEPQGTVTVEILDSAAATPIFAETAEGPTPLPFVVTTATGAAIGSFDFARIVEAIATGHVGPTDRVARGASPPVPIYEHADLARHVPPSSFTPITKESPAAATPIRRVEMKDAGFVRALARTVAERETGLWLCEQGATRKEIYLEQGVPAFVTSNLASELLGESLVARGLVTRGEMDMTLAVMPRYEGKLGDTLVALGLVEPVRLFQHIGTQVTEKLLDVFVWASGEASFYRGVPPPKSGFPLALDAWSILDEGIRRRLAEGLDDDVFASRLADSLVRATPMPFPIARSSLSPLLLDALRLAESPIGLQELVAALEDPSGRDPGRGYRLVSILLRLEAIRWVA